MRTKRLHAAFVALLLLVPLAFFNQVGLLRSLLRYGRGDDRQTLEGLPPGAVETCFGPGSRRSSGGAERRPVRISLIAASANRTDSVLRVLPSWRAMRALDEIVLLDWGSSPPLRSALASAPAGEGAAEVSPSQLRTAPELRIVRATHEREWALARAYNLLAQLVRPQAPSHRPASAETAPPVPARPVPRL